MSRKLTFFLSVLVILFSGLAAHAAEYDPKEDVAEITRQLNDSRFEEKLQVAISGLIATAVERLEQEGHQDLADEISGEWVQVAATNFSAFGLLDLGDHQPLNQWLARTYSKIESKLGPTICKVLGLYDLKILNYAIPVVFRPNGGGGDSWDKEEYRKHFVPFSGVVTYWSVNVSCRVWAVGLWVRGCGIAAAISRFSMEKWIAPYVSDRVYGLATGKNRSSQPVETFDYGALLSQAERELSLQ
ncbi:MAG: hypothetical protein KGQ59_06985 [Bdellovibrionales bacterium]|nr:hypothetical protein [Bdellovibrionales bacterium]